MLRRSSRSYLLAVVVALLLLAWLALGDLQRFRAEPPEGDAAVERPLPRIEVRDSEAQPYRPHLLTQGHLSAWQSVELRIRTGGVVSALPIVEGEAVKAGDVMLRLAEEDRPAQLARARAELEAAQAELTGAERLRQRDLVSRNELLQLKSRLAQARAEVASLTETVAQTRPAAPFDGVLDRLTVDLGDVLQSGESYGLLIDDRRLEANAFVPQRDALGLEPGLPVTVRLLDGRELEGRLRHVASQADDETRSFAVEAIIENPERRRLAGASATLEISRPERRAHRLSPALLVLDDQGRLGVKVVDDDRRVAFRPVSLLSADSDRAWVAGLPERVTLITLGGGFVDAGERVETVPETGPDADPRES